MERMNKVNENIQTAQNMLSGIIERCYQLEEENEKLKELLDVTVETKNDHIQKLIEERDYYKEELSKLKEKYGDIDL